jgi:hypothetical protein
LERITSGYGGTPFIVIYSDIFIEDGKNKEDLIQRVKVAKVMFNYKQQLLCSNNLSLETKKKLINFVFGVLLFVDQKQRP